MLLMASQLGLRFRPLLLSFKGRAGLNADGGRRSQIICHVFLVAGLDSLLHKDWRGRGFDQDVDRLIEIIQSEKDVKESEVWLKLRPKTLTFSTNKISLNFYNF